MELIGKAGGIMSLQGGGSHAANQEELGWPDARAHGKHGVHLTEGLEFCTDYLLQVFICLKFKLSQGACTLVTLGNLLGRSGRGLLASAEKEPYALLCP